MGERIKIAEAWAGQHAFDGSTDRRAFLSRTLRDCQDADIVVFPCGQDRRLERLQKVVFPPALLERIAAHRTRLVFDASTEGVRHKPDMSAALHAAIERFGADPADCAYLTQDRQYEADYRTHSAAIGRPTVRILVHDYWIWRTVGEFAAVGEDVYSERCQAFRARRRTRQRRFVSLNRTARHNKLLVLLQLLDDGLFRDGYVSFGGFGLKGTTKLPSLADLEREVPWAADLLPRLEASLPALAAYGPVLFGDGEPQAGATRADALDIYQDSWVSLVTETEMRARVTRVTEKVLKPLLNAHPFVVFGNPGSLGLIRELGFQTFAPAIDESYDEDLDPRRRFDLAYREAARLIRADDQDLARLEASLAEVLLCNLRHGLMVLPARKRHVDCQLLAAVLTPAPARAL